MHYWGERRSSNVYAATYRAVLLRRQGLFFFCDRRSEFLFFALPAVALWSYAPNIDSETASAER